MQSAKCFLARQRISLRTVPTVGLHALSTRNHASYSILASAASFIPQRDRAIDAHCPTERQIKGNRRENDDDRYGKSPRY